MEFYNGKIIYKGEKVFIENTSQAVNSEDAEIITTGTSTIVLPAIDGTIFDLHIYVKSGTCQITGTVDGVVNPVLQAANLEYDIFCNGAAYFTIPTEKENFFVNTRPQQASVSTYTQAGVIAINTVLMTIDCRDCTAISISSIAMGTTGVVTPRWVNEIGDPGQAATIMTPAGATATTFNGAGMWVVPVVARYLTLVLTTATTGGTTTIRATKLFGAIPSQFVPTIGTQAVSGSLTSAGTVTNTPANPTVNTLNSAATTNATSVKTSAGNLHNMAISNTSASPRYLKLYNKASAPTVGTDVPVLTITLPANSFNPINFGVTGYRFATGIAFAITGAAADNDTTAIGASEVKVLTSYI